MLVADELLRRAYREIRGLRARVEGRAVDGFHDMDLIGEIREYLAEFDAPIEEPVEGPYNRLLRIDVTNTAYQINEWIRWVWRNIDDSYNSRFFIDRLEAIYVAVSENVSISRQVGMVLANQPDNPGQNIDILLNSMLLEETVQRHLSRRRNWLFRTLNIFPWKPKQFNARLNAEPTRFMRPPAQQSAAVRGPGRPR